MGKSKGRKKSGASTKSKTSTSSAAAASLPEVSYVDESELKYDSLIKLILIGDPGVGKTALMERFATQDFDSALHMVSTIGVDFRVRMLRVGNTVYKVQLWDTAGQERFRSITTAYYGSAAAILIVYDCTDHSESATQQVKGWIHEASRHNQNAAVVIVANKVDLVQEEQQQQQVDALPLHTQHEFAHVRVSAKTGQGFAELLSRTMAAVTTAAGTPKSKTSSTHPTPAKPTSIPLPKSKTRRLRLCSCFRRHKMFEQQKTPDSDVQLATVRLHGQKAKLRVSVDSCLDTLDDDADGTHQQGSTKKPRAYKTRRKSCPPIPLGHEAIMPEHSKQLERTASKRRKCLIM